MTPLLLLAALSAEPDVSRFSAEPREKTLRLSAGYSRRKFFGVPAEAAQLELAPSWQLAENFAFSLPSSVRLGRTESGLTLTAVSVGFEPELVFGRLRLSVAGGLAVDGVKRAIFGRVWSWGPSLAAALRFDVLHATGSVFFVRMSGDATVIHHSIENSADYGVTFALGADFGR